MRQCGRIVNTGERRVENPMAAIGNKDLSILLSSQDELPGLLDGADRLLQRTLNGCQSKRNHFNWQWKMA